jgi:hypothetical protein
MASITRPYSQIIYSHFIYQEQVLPLQFSILAEVSLSSSFLPPSFSPDSLPHPHSQEQA